MNYKTVNGFVICKLPDIYEIDMEQVEMIVQHTHNTWQHNRPIEEIRQNTIQGKRAELVIENILEENSAARYLSYDAIRRDNFGKHAPFDGILYQIDTPKSVVKASVERINSDVRMSAGDSGMITVATRQFLENHGIYTIEIKSSLLQDPRDYRKMEHKYPGKRTIEDYEALCAYIKGFYDYFVYPHYCRDGLKIEGFYEYVKYVQSIPGLIFPRDKRAFLYELMKTEFDNACNVYTRVFFDVLSDELIVPGYLLKGRFFEEPRIGKMPSLKSANAVYYMYHMRFGLSFLDIDRDDELWNWNRQAAYAKLFGAVNPDCPVCGRPLRIVETVRDNSAHKFLYVCDSCPKNSKWNELGDIYRRNMVTF